MTASLASWLVIAVALALANLPFYNEHVFGFIPLKPAKPGLVRAKHALWRLFELLALYCIVGLVPGALLGACLNAMTKTLGS